jgi:hypothetical protein
MPTYVGVNDGIIGGVVPSVFTTITFFFLSLNLLIGWHLPI